MIASLFGNPEIDFDLSGKKQTNLMFIKLNVDLKLLYYTLETLHDAIMIFMLINTLKFS